MNEIGNSKFSIFDFIVYLLPGLILMLFVMLFVPGMPYIDTIPEFSIAVIFAFLIGNIFHEFAFIPVQFFWLIYKLFKERNSEGHGVKEPKYIWGKFAKFLRYGFLELNKSEAVITSANELITQKYNLKTQDYLGNYYLKEVNFIKDPELRKGFEYLQHQGLFSKSMSFCLFIISLLSLYLSLMGDFALYRQGVKVIDFEWFGLSFFIISLISVPIFVRRYKFFELYRKQIIDANVIMSFYE